MLILTRNISETVKINHDIEVTVLGIKGGQVRLGFAAPHHVEIHREEIYEKIYGDKEPPSCSCTTTKSAPSGNA